MFDWLKGLNAPAPRHGMPSPRLDEAEFKRRFRNQFRDPDFAPLSAELDRITDAAWDAYAHSRKSPQTHKAGPGYADPDYELAYDWIAAHEAITDAQSAHEDRSGARCILLINGSPRSEHTCPGEMSKSFRLVEIARQVFEQNGARIDVLDLSRVTSEYGRHIHPCKACFSTAAPLCHWPCSCYPNYSLGQTHDWMNDIYPKWVAAHGVMIITPVNWYHVTSPMKLMMDRLVCADGGNPDPTRTQGKDAALAKRIELAGWNYPRHLAGRRFSVVAHGDTEGATDTRRALTDWLVSMHLEPAQLGADLDRYIGYWKPYATSHDELDADTALQDEVRVCAAALINAVTATRRGNGASPPLQPKSPREK